MMARGSFNQVRRNRTGRSDTIVSFVVESEGKPYSPSVGASA